jgi:two-component system OmpR family response regulator
MRLLIAEDEVRLAMALSRGLTHAGFAVDTVHDGKSALHRALDDPYDLIVLDIMLPALSGYEVIRRVRAARVWTPILVVSAKDGDYDEADGLDLGADDYVKKPISFVVLLAHIRALLRRGIRPRPTVIVAGGISVDLATHAVRVGEREVDLTPREFALLQYLALRPGEVVSKAELIEHVWPAKGADPNTVEVYAGSLRRKLGPGALQTVRGAGYRLVT